MADRRAEVVMLLASRFDFDWLPPGSLRTQPGLAPADRRPCVTCGGVEIRDDFGKLIRRRKGRGTIVDGFKQRTRCPTCNGDGWTARDRMDSRRTVLGSEQTSASARPRRQVHCDRCGGAGVWKGDRCELCDGSGKRDLHVFELALDAAGEGADDPVAAAFVRRDAAGSYHELDLALAGVIHHVNKPAEYAALTGKTAVQAVRLLDQLYLPPPDLTLAELSPYGRLIAGVALAYIDWRMPDPIRVPGDVRHNHDQQAAHLARVRGRGADPRALEQRNIQARVWAREGRPYPWIQSQLGLSDRQLRAILNGDTEAA